MAKNAVNKRMGGGRGGGRNMTDVDHTRKKEMVVGIVWSVFLLLLILFFVLFSTRGVYVS